MALTDVLILPVRVVQGVLTLIVLGLTADVTTNWWTPSQINFLVFVSVWTLLALAYLVFAPMFHQPAAHKYGILFAEALTMLFWFAGFIALAALLSDFRCGAAHSRWCGESIAATVFGAFEWVLFCGTTAMAALHCWGSRGGSAKPAHNMEVHPPYQGA